MPATFTSDLSPVERERADDLGRRLAYDFGTAGRDHALDLLARLAPRFLDPVVLSMGDWLIDRAADEGYRPAMCGGYVL